MKKSDLAYKLTADIIKKYDLKELEAKYDAYGGKLISLIFNEIFTTISLPDETPKPTIINNIPFTDD